MRANNRGNAVTGMASAYGFNAANLAQSITRPFKANRPCGRF
jgi:hypothetical protein